MAGPIRLAADLTQEEVQQSAVARNALILLRAAAAGPGLKMTATGNLVARRRRRNVRSLHVAGLRQSWCLSVPQGHQRAGLSAPLFCSPHCSRAGTLLRKHKGHLKISPAGTTDDGGTEPAALQALLFHITMWHLDLGYLGRGLHHGWPQRDAGIVLWSLVDRRERLATA